FAHPLLASTLLEMHTLKERRAVHRSLADMLEDPDERALHLARGTEEASEVVALELERSAGRLDQRGAPETAALLAERAAALARLCSVAGDYRAWLRHAELAVEAGAALEANALFPSPLAELGFAKLIAGQGLDEELFERGIELESKLANVSEPYQSPRMSF